MMTLEHAGQVALYLLGGLPNICEAMGLFGSVARNGDGNDIDIIVFVSSRWTSKGFYSFGL